LSKLQIFKPQTPFINLLLNFSYNSNNKKTPLKSKLIQTSNIQTADPLPLPKNSFFIQLSLNIQQISVECLKIANMTGLLPLQPTQHSNNMNIDFLTEQIKQCSQINQMKEKKRAIFVFNFHPQHTATKKKWKKWEGSNS
jgi:hypothetical protein